MIPLRMIDMRVEQYRNDIGPMVTMDGRWEAMPGPRYVTVRISLEARVALSDAPRGAYPEVDVIRELMQLRGHNRLFLTTVDPDEPPTPRRFARMAGYDEYGVPFYVHGDPPVRIQAPRPPEPPVAPPAHRVTGRRQISEDDEGPRRRRRRR